MNKRKVVEVGVVKRGRSGTNYYARAIPKTGLHYTHFLFTTAFLLIGADRRGYTSTWFMPTTDGVHPRWKQNSNP